MATYLCSVIRQFLPQISRLSCRTCTNPAATVCNRRILSKRDGRPTCAASLHTSARRRGLMEFIELKENWGEKDVKVGRPWRKDELRIKANTDLHKLWYVLLKERNMLMTMEELYKTENALFPNPERIEKVEESMENLLEVVAERDRAYHLCETGVTGELGERPAIDALGRDFRRRNQEHYVPFELSGRYERREAWQEKYLTLQQEKDRAQEQGYQGRKARRRRRLERCFPNADPADFE